MHTQQILQSQWLDFSVLLRLDIKLSQIIQKAKLDWNKVARTGKKTVVIA